MGLKIGVNEVLTASIARLEFGTKEQSALEELVMMRTINEMAVILLLEER